jgi:hypothetical protein
MLCLACNHVIETYSVTCVRCELYQKFLFGILIFIRVRTTKYNMVELYTTLDASGTRRWLPLCLSVRLQNSPRVRVCEKAALSSVIDALTLQRLNFFFFVPDSTIP